MQISKSSPVLDNTFEMIIMFDMEGNIFYANNSAVEKLEYENELNPASIADVFPSVYKMGGDRLNTLINITESPFQTNAYRGNRTCFLVEAKIVREFSEEGSYNVCYATDISEKNLLEKKVFQTRQEAETALKVKSEFVSNITHELKTPVNGILGNIRELEGLEDNPDKKRLIRLVERGCADMQSIIGNVLDFSKLEAGKVMLEPREFNIREMFDYIKSNHIHKITEKGLDFFINVSPDIPEIIIGDELRIAQVVNNLISNAIKFTHIGKIMVQVAKTAQFKRQVELFFFVIDTGIGIDETDQQKLFKSFSQVDASITRKYGGTGLGLNICKQLVELMDGSISVESKKNQGSVFSFHIWVGLPEDEVQVETANADINATMQKMREEVSETGTAVNVYGTEENKAETEKMMSKLVLCLEMENWEKAETFAEALKHLTQEAPKEIKLEALKLKMAVQKEDYEKSMASYKILQEGLGLTEV